MINLKLTRDEVEWLDYALRKIYTENKKEIEVAIRLARRIDRTIKYEKRSL